MGMTNALVRLAAGLLCSIALVPTAAAQDDAARIRAGTELWVKSFNAGNAGAVVALYSNDKAGKTVDAGKFLEAWQRKDGKWRIVRDMWNSDGAPAAAATFEK